jgi:hypothetical protein
MRTFVLKAVILRSVATKYLGWGEERAKERCFADAQHDKKKVTFFTYVSAYALYPL